MAYKGFKGEESEHSFMFKRKDGNWDAATIWARSRELARQIVIGKYAPVKFANKIA